MKKSKTILIIAVLGILSMVAISYIIKNKGRYEIYLPEQSQIVKVELNGSEQKVIEDKYLIKKIMDIIEGSKRKTNKKSINDYTYDASNILKVEFDLQSGSSVVFYVYQKGNRYYIEQPYNGI